MVATTQILIIEDNRLVRDGLGALLAAQPGFKVVVAAEGGNLGLDRVRQLRPAIVLVDAGRENADKHRLVEDLLTASCASKVIVMGLLPARRDVVEFIRAGASGFILSDATVEDFLLTIRTVAEGGNVVPPALAGTLMTWIADHAVTRRVPDMAAVRMTKREREVVELIAEGLSNKEIAQRLNLATYTVKSHVHNILDKLALHSRLQVAAHVHRTASV